VVAGLRSPARELMRGAGGTMRSARTTLTGRSEHHREAEQRPPRGMLDAATTATRTNAIREPIVTKVSAGPRGRPSARLVACGGQLATSGSTLAR
jgi:hypothetical protein